MEYISLGENKQSVSLKEGIFKGLSDDGHLFMPREIPELTPEWISSLPALSLHEIASAVLWPYVEEELTEKEFNQIIHETFSFPIPLVNLHDNIHVLELFHGPTQAFKDVGARFLSRLMSHLHPAGDNKMIVLTATSGDTGGAVAHGFYKVPGIDVVVLYPKGKISPYQEQQMTGLGHNIHAVAVDGAFDDCQRLVKQAFNDKELRQNVAVTSANSINLGRLLPQMVYYFEGVARLQEKHQDIHPVLCVPSGNFGNITAAVMASRMGLPVGRFVAATNVNDVVPRFIDSGNYDPHETIVTLANAMDVGDPSNFPRLFHLFRNDLDEVRKFLSAHSVTDAEIKDTIKKIYNRYGYVLDPHSSAGYLGLAREIDQNEQGFFVATAHPRKFVETIDEVLPNVAKNLREEYGPDFASNSKQENMSVSYSELRHFLESIG
ncbi:MAG: threonine synthase [Marinilabiliaceae bacterium]